MRLSYVFCAMNAKNWKFVYDLDTPVLTFFTSARMQTLKIVNWFIIQYFTSSKEFDIVYILISHTGGCCDPESLLFLGIDNDWAVLIETWDAWVETKLLWPVFEPWCGEPYTFEYLSRVYSPLPCRADDIFLPFPTNSGELVKLFEPPATFRDVVIPWERDVGVRYSWGMSRLKPMDYIF